MEPVKNFVSWLRDLNTCLERGGQPFEDTTVPPRPVAVSDALFSPEQELRFRTLRKLLEQVQKTDS